MRVLVAGATGMVGGEAARILSSGGDVVRALVRSTSSGIESGERLAGAHAKPDDCRQADSWASI